MVLTSSLAALVLAANAESVLVVPGARLSPQNAELEAALSQVIAREAQQVAPSGARVLSADDLRVVLGQERQKALLGCEESSDCMAELTAALNATEIISSSASLVSSGLTGQEWVVEVKRLEGRGRGRLGAAVVSVCGGGPKLLDAAARAVREAFGAPQGQPGHCPSPVGVIGVAAGSALAVVGGVGIGLALVTKNEFDAQQPPTAPLTVTRAEAQTAQVLFVSGLVAAGLGAGVAIVSGVVLTSPPRSPAVTLVPLGGGGALVTVGGAF